MKVRSAFKFLIFFSILAFAVYLASLFKEYRMLREIVKRLNADSRIAEVIVTEYKPDPLKGQAYTTIKFLEYDTKQNPLEPRYFTFSGNIIQFQSLVIRFDDFYVEQAHPLKGKSAYIFMKAFSLLDKGAEVREINRINEIPSGYIVSSANNFFEKRLWEKFWDYALRKDTQDQSGVKCAQIEAPGTKFVPGLLYTVRIEHDGGMRIDAQKLPGILKGERIP
jgi:hypothetical protein